MHLRLVQLRSQIVHDEPHDVFPLLVRGSYCASMGDEQADYPPHWAAEQLDHVGCVFDNSASQTVPSQSRLLSCFQTTAKNLVGIHRDEHCFAYTTSPATTITVSWTRGLVAAPRQPRRDHATTDETTAVRRNRPVVAAGGTPSIESGAKRTDATPVAAPSISLCSRNGTKLGRQDAIRALLPWNPGVIDRLAQPSHTTRRIGPKHLGALVWQTDAGSVREFRPRLCTTAGHSKLSIESESSCQFVPGGADWRLGLAGSLQYCMDLRESSIMVLSSSHRSQRLIERIGELTSQILANMA